MGEQPHGSEGRLVRLVKRVCIPLWARGLRDLAAAAALLALLITGYLISQTPVYLHVDGQVKLAGTHQATVGALLQDLGVTLDAADRVEPQLSTALTPGMHIYIHRARTVEVHVDGQIRTVRTQSHSPWAALDQLGISLDPADQLYVDGQLIRSVPGSAAEQPSVDLLASTVPLGVAQEPDTTTLVVRRATPFVLDDNGTRLTLKTTEPTLGQALRSARILLYLGDQIHPSLGTPMVTGLRAEIRRSIPVSIQADGHTLRTRTFRATVGDVLAEIGVALIGQDYTIPAVDASLTPDMNIRVIRVHEEFISVQTAIGFQTLWQADPDLEIRLTRVVQEGVPGVMEHRYRARYEDGREVSRETIGDWVALAPTTLINAYGTKIPIRVLNTSDGPIQYWWTFRMWATSYTATSAGKSYGSYGYGITRSGIPLHTGIVAVDPRVIPLGSHVYVPGYGIALAADTGSGIIGKWIDLGYDDSSYRSWARYVDVYLMPPIPPNAFDLIGGLPLPPGVNP